MANDREKDISILVGNFNSGLSNIITSVPVFFPQILIMLTQIRNLSTKKHLRMAK